jgi:hypothetical protein
LELGILGVCQVGLLQIVAKNYEVSFILNEDRGRGVGRGVTEPTGDDTFSMEIGIQVIAYRQIASHLSESYLQVKE